MSDFISADIPPPTLEPEFACLTCGAELTYAGRGRKPSYCAEHKKGRTAAPVATAGKQNKLAGPAADALVQLNNLISTGMLFGGMPKSASALASRQEGFREAAYQALLTDEPLCRSIIGAGQASAKLTLLIAYATMIGSVAPYAIDEVKVRRNERAQTRAENSGTA